VQAVAAAHRHERGAEPPSRRRPPRGGRAARFRGSRLGGRGPVPRDGAPRLRAARGTARRGEPPRGTPSPGDRVPLLPRPVGGGDRGSTRLPPRHRQVASRARARTAARRARRRGGVTNLEHELRGLAPFVELPPERALAPAVRARIGARRPRPGKLVLALAVVVLAIAVAFAVPPARSAILRWLGLGNARIEFVDTLPKVTPRPRLD